MQKESLAKVVIIGEARVGKTSILTRYTSSDFHENMIPTLGIDYRLKRIEIDDQQIKLQIWDTAGQERFRAITQNFYKGAMGIILVFDMNDPSTLEQLKTWLESIKIFQTQEVVKVIFANKSDLEQKVTMNECLEQIEEQNGIPVFQVSAKTNENIDQGFDYLAKQIKKIYFTNKKHINDSDKKIFQTDELPSSKLVQQQNYNEEQEKKCC